MNSFTVYGLPAPQGSKRHVGHGIMIESSKRVKPWREAVKTEALEARDGRSPLTGPLAVSIQFILPRPKGHFGTGRNAGEVKKSAPLYPSTRPDLDKLVRSTLDGLVESGLFGDDSQIVQLDVAKGYPEWGQDTPGAVIAVWEAENWKAEYEKLLWSE